MSDTQKYRRSSRVNKGVPPKKYGFEEDQGFRSQTLVTVEVVRMSKSLSRASGGSERVEDVSVHNAGGDGPGDRNSSKKSKSVKSNSVASSVSVVQKKSSLVFDEKIADLKQQIRQLKMNRLDLINEYDVLVAKLDAELLETEELLKEEVDPAEVNRLKKQKLKAEQQLKFLRSQHTSSVGKLEISLEALEEKISLVQQAKEIALLEIVMEENEEREPFDHGENNEQDLANWVRLSTEEQAREAQNQQRAKDLEQKLKEERELEEALRQSEVAKLQEDLSKLEQDRELKEKELKAKLATLKPSEAEASYSVECVSTKKDEGAAPEQMMMLYGEAIKKLLENSSNPQDKSSNSKFLARQSHAKELPFFGGELEEWPQFITEYKRTTEICGFSNSENTTQLRKYLKGDALKLLFSLMINPDNVPHIIERLESRYGQPKHIVHAMIERVTKAQNVKLENLESLIEFGQIIDGLVSTIQVMNCKEHLNNPMLLEQLESKLPVSLKMHWLDWRDADSSKCHNLENFAIWMEKRSKLAYEMCPPKHHEERREKEPFKRFDKRRDNRRQEGVFAIDEEKGKEVKRSLCDLCEIPGHWISDCRKFKSKSTEERWKVAKEKRLCVACLARGHIFRHCRKKVQCGIEKCVLSHHKLLHGFDGHKVLVTREGHNNVKKDDTPAEQVHSVDLPKDISETVLWHAGESTGSILGVMPVWIKGSKRMELIWAFIDNGSSVTLLEQETADRVGVKGKPQPFCIATLHSSQNEKDSELVNVQIQGNFDRAKTYWINGLRTVKNLPLKPVSLNVEALKEKYPYLKDVPVESFYNITPRILIDVRHCFFTTPIQSIGQSMNSPMAFRSRLGWSIAGPQRLSRDRVDTGLVHHICELEEQEDLHELVKRSYTTEDFGVKIIEEKPRSKEDQRALQMLKDTTKRVAGDTRFTTGLLWKQKDLKLPESKTNAVTRLMCQERKMDRDPEFAKWYLDKMTEYETKGFISKLTEEQASAESPITWYLPHFGVKNQNKPGKVRLVFDAAARTNGTSLNKMLMQGPDLANSMFSVLQKFRQYKVAFCGDIKDMFHRVFIRDEDLPAQRFLWRGLERDRDPDTYQMNVMIFGSTCSPSAAQFVKNANANEHILKYPEASRAIIDKMYVDDFLDSKNDESEAIKIIQEVIEVNKLGGFEICNWISNSKEVMAAIPVELRGKEVKDLDLQKAQMPVGRVLGLWWDTEMDKITFLLNFHKVPPEIQDGTKRPTKRDILKLVMSVYDPMGYLSHLVIKAKILMQDVWRSGIGWDDEISDVMMSKWVSWLSELQSITEVRISRCYSEKIPESSNKQLHVFCDASEKAFAAVVFLRVKSEGKIDVSIVAAKSRVSPLKPMSIPRLELQAAVLGTRLVGTIQEHLEFKIDATHLWSDSKTVLCWLRSDTKRFKQFVAHRVGEILESTDVSEWHWVPSKLNVADDATRDEMPSDLSETSRWFKGESFLLEEESQWPQEQTREVGAADYQEDTTCELVNVIKDSVNDTAIVNINDFSEWRRLREVTAWVMRFARNVRLPKANRITHSSVTHAELEDATTYWTKYSQKAMYPIEIEDLHGGKQQNMKWRDHLYKYKPFIGIGDLLRVGGRLKKAALPYDVKHPIILAQRHKFTELLVNYYHVRCAHQGRETVMNMIKQKYHIVGLSAAVKRAFSNCMECKIRKARPIEPEMADLPEVRTKAFIRPFTNTGLDFFGPIEVAVGRRREKRWGAIFTCLSTRAVHVEIANHLTTDSAIMAIQRMGSRRGYPNTIYSDNGTNFHGANKEIKKAVQELDDCQLRKCLANVGVQWVLNPPAAPHFGGCWERLVGSIKKVLYVILKERTPTDEVLYTLLTEAEAIINNRPLTHVSVDPNDPESLTPNHFLIGWSGLSPKTTPPVLGKFDDHDLWLRKQWRCAQRLADHFWTRWIKEYLPTLTRREKWNKQTRPIEVGDIVIIADNQEPRNVWPKGIIVAVHPGRDGQVRVVDVKTETGVFRRPVVKLCVLDVRSTQDQEDGIPSSGGRMSRPEQDNKIRN